MSFTQGLTWVICTKIYHMKLRILVMYNKPFCCIYTSSCINYCQWKYNLHLHACINYGKSVAIAIGHIKKYGRRQSKVLPLEDRWQCQGYPQGRMRGSKPWLPDPPTLIASPWIIEQVCKLCPGIIPTLAMNVPNHIIQCLLTIASSKLFIINKCQLIMNLYVL